MRFISLAAVLMILLMASGCGFLGGDNDGGDVGATEPTATPAPEPTPEPEPEPTETPVQELSWEDVVEKLEPSTVMVRADFPETAVSYEGQGSGTGIVYSEDGYILTNAHVVSGAAALTVATAGSSKERSARFIGVSPCDDLAVIQVTDMSDLEVAEFGDTSNERVGAEVAALGYPLGEMLSLDLTVNRGVISKMNEQLWEFESLIQHDATINNGNSGGPLVNRRGEVIGVNTVSVHPDYADNLNFAIDINQAKRIIEQLEDGKNIGWLGMNLEPNFYPDYFGTEEGLIVAAVASGSSASKVGVKAPYLLTKLQGMTVNSSEEICRIVRSHSEGDALKVEFMHITETEVQYLEGEVVLGDASGGQDLSVVHSVIFNDSQTAANGEAEQLSVGRWQGVATVVVDYWAPCGADEEWQNEETLTFQHDVNVLVDIPFEGEYNPYWIEIYSETEDEGGFWVLSSWEYTDGSLGEYWELEYEGTNVFGEMYASQISDGELGNMFYSYLTNNPCSDAEGGQMSELEMATGSAFSGYLDASGGQINITGMTADLFRDFDVTIDLVRVQ